MSADTQEGASMTGQVISMNSHVLENGNSDYGDDYSFLDDMTDEEIRDYIEKMSDPKKRISKPEDASVAVDTDHQDANDPDINNAYSYREATADFPVCNHVDGVGPENIGYSQGILPDGTPYEAELWNNDESGQSISVLIPVLDFRSFQEDCSISFSDHEETDLREHREMELPPIPSKDCGVLAIGMIENGDEDDDTITFQYVDYLEKSGILQFTGEIKNGFVCYMSDANGTELAQIIVTMSVRKRTDAVTDLHFRPFFGAYRKGRIYKWNR